MKFLILALLASSSFAAEPIFTMKNPRYPLSNLGFYKYSSLDGICIALGFGRALKESIKEEYSDSTCIEMDAQGNVAKARTGSNYIVAEISCLEFRGNGNPETTFFVENPRHPQSQLPFSKNSLVNGICLALGYDKGVEGSIKEGEYGNDSLVMNADGTVKNAASGHYQVGSIVCSMKPRRLR